MTITDVWVRKITKEGKLRAIVSITLDNEFVVHDIKVIEGEKGLFIAMPSKKTAGVSGWTPEQLHRRTSDGETERSDRTKIAMASGILCRNAN